ncbi:MAE_28990/MAE_18760 family HEPN-like nuclease [Paenibacillus sp. FSL H7-0442]|uniref:MAE_28990/MAE_18760 family HEPN-like nuclease n=1 Tax=Paenibacillus sp. FSL H7-0442 TaxID=2921435 RepID=UPI00315941A8
MDIADVIAQIEEELTWREDELRFLRNQLSNMTDEEDKMRYRKSLVVMLYSYYEGFCKASFQIYINTINQSFLARNLVNDYISTASMNEVFLTYHNESKKSPHFNKELPDDSKLHRYSRQVDFIQALENIWEEIVTIPENIVDTESNLKPVVLRKILYRLGFQYDCFKQYEGQINLLLERRNSVAHGAMKEGFTKEKYDTIERAALDIMTELKKLIVDALIYRNYLKHSDQCS